MSLAEPRWLYGSRGPSTQKEIAMHKFMCSHTLPAGEMTRDQVCQVSEAAQHDSAVRGYRSFINLSEGKACCVLEADDRQSIAAWFQKMGFPFDAIVEVEYEGDRGEIHDLKEEPAAVGAR
jgi:hypothetical protein